jgi:hypothetical protein
MLHTRARVSAIVAMNVKDYGAHDGQRSLRLREPRGKTHDASVNKAAGESLDAYVEAGGLRENPDSPLWRTMTEPQQVAGRLHARRHLGTRLSRHEHGTWWRPRIS